MLSRTVDNKLRNKVSFVETSHVTDSALAKILLDLDVQKDSEESSSPVAVSASTGIDVPQLQSPLPPPQPSLDISQPNSVSSNERDVLIADFDADNLDPKLLLIDDDDDDDKSADELLNSIEKGIPSF